GVVRGTAIVFFAYLGFDTVAATAEESRNPRRDLPIGIIGSVTICMLLYVGMALVLLGMVPYVDLTGGAPVADAFIAKGMNAVAGIVTVGAIIALTTVAYAFQLALVRILRAMAM